MKVYRAGTWFIWGVLAVQAQGPEFISSVPTFKVKCGWVVVSHTFDPNTCEIEAGRSVSSRSTWSSEQVLEQPGLHTEKSI